MPETWKEKGPRPEKWPCLGISDDQGGDHNAATSWCENAPEARMNMDRLPDVIHGNNNDLKLNPRQVGLSGHQLLNVLSYNIWEKPFKGAANHATAQQLIRAWANGINPKTDVLWQDAYPDILVEIGQSDRLAEENIEAIVGHPLHF